MIQIFRKEFNSFLNSLIAYIVMGVFLTAIGLLMWVFPDTSILDYGYADMDTLFSFSPYIFVFLIPAITMRSFAEERKIGTLEFLLTKPITDWQLVVGKFMASVALVLLTLLPTLLYYVSVYYLGNPVGNIDTAGVAGSYVGLILLSMVFCSIGIFASSLTSNQIISFILAAFSCFIFYTGFDALSSLSAFQAVAFEVKQLGALAHYESLGRGLVDSRDIVYLMSVSAFVLLVTKTIVASRSW